MRIHSTDLTERNYRINASIVSFDRPDNLCRLIESLLNQTFPVNKIIVIDNSLTNSVQKVLKDRYPKIIYKKMSENTGSAGGFCEAIRTGARDSDFTWLFDDDVYLMPDALESVVRWIPALKRNGRLGALKSWYTRSKTDVPQPITSFAWRGTMINSEVTKVVGYPDTDFFLYGEDVDYSFRIHKEGYSMYYVPNSIMVAGGKETKMRLCFLGITMSLHSTPVRLYYGIRNELILYKRHRMLNRWIKSLLYSLKLILFVLLATSYSKKEFLKPIIIGISHGLIGKMGKNPNIRIGSQDYV